MLTCSEVGERLVAWQDHELSPGEMVLVGEHLERCQGCRVRERRLAAATPGPLPRVPRDVQADLWAKLDAALDDAAGRPAAPSLPPVRPWRVPSALQVAYAAALLAALVWGWLNHVNAQNLQAALETERARHVAGAEIPADQFRPVSFVPGEAEEPPGDAPSPR